MLSVRSEIFASDQMLLARLGKSLRQIDDSCTAEISVERHFFDRFGICVEMKPRIRMRAVVHAHRDRAEVYARTFGDLVRQTIIERFVTWPFGEVVRKRS